MRRFAEGLIAEFSQQSNDTSVDSPQKRDDGPPSETTMAYREAMGTLQKDAQIRYTGDADKDFASLLAAYKKCTVALAGIELRDGKDPKTHRLADKVIASK